MPAPLIQVHDFGNGLDHARGVVAQAARLAREDSSDYAIRSLATKITHGVPSKQTRAEVAALYQWVRDNIRYRFDPVGVEWLQRPTRTLIERAGDCDDLATLLASLVQSLGHPVRWRVVGPRGSVPKHIAAEAWVKHPGAPRGEWISLDPVMEPAQATTAPRAELGAFGQRATGVEHIFTEGGTMLNGVVDARGRELWQWVQWFHPPKGGLAQVSPVPIDLRYRMASQPSDPRRVFAAYRAELAHKLQPGSGLAGPFEDPTLGFGFLKLLKPLAKVASAVGVPGAGAISVGLDVASRLSKKKAPAVPGVPQAVPINATPITSAAPAPVVNCATPQALNAIQTELKRHFRSDEKRDRTVLKAANITIKADKAARKRAAKKKQDRLIEKRARKLAAQMVAKLRASGGWPAGARQSYDPNTRSFHVFAPTTMGAIGFAPSFAVSFSGAQLGARGSRNWVQVRPYNVQAHRRHWPAHMAAATQSEANAAIAAVASFIRRHKTPPLISLAPVLAFQTAVANLDRDGLWGPNTRRAAAYYSGAAERGLPAVAARFARLVATWAPPAAVPIVAPSSTPQSVVLPHFTVPAPPASSDLSPERAFPAPAPVPSAPLAPSLLPPSTPTLAPIAVVPADPGLPPLPGSPIAPPSSAATPPPFPGDAGSAVVVSVDPFAPTSDLAPWNENYAPPERDNTWLWLAGLWWLSKRRKRAA